MKKSNSDQSPMGDSLKVDQLCDQFEHAWRNNTRPRIESALSKVDSRLHSQLFEQLLYLELELSDAKPSLTDYTHRFPEFSAQVQTIFEELDLIDWTGSRLGPFEIIEEVARGGMGVVYLANDSRLQRRVAIKMINRDRRTESKWMRRFRREARLASGLNHPNIVTIYEIGEENGISYLACEFVDGVTLRERIAEGPLTAELVADYSCQIASGMAAAHAAGVIHRDLKADNIMVRGDNLLKILDFGLAKEFNDERQVVTKTGAITGTVSFMSPEQARGHELTTSTDVFSFGIVLYLMVTGELPFTGDTTSDVLVAIMEHEPKDLSEFEFPINQRLEKLLFQCLKKNPKERPNFPQIMEAITEVGEHRSPTWSRSGQIAADESSLPQSEIPHQSTVDRELTSIIHSDSGLLPSFIRYARSGDLNIAWQEIGTGTIDIVFVMGWVSHLDWFWKDPSFSAFLRRLAKFARVILFDKRGTGLSDKVPMNELPDLETRMDDVRAVMESANSKRAVLCGISEGGPLCALFAATFPEKTIALTMIGSYSRRLWAEDYPWGPTAEQRQKFLQEIERQWGGPVGLEERAPSMANNPRFREWWASYLRMGASPGAAIALTKMNAQIDVRPILPSIRVPALVLHRTGDQCLSVDEGRYLAEKIPGAKFVELPGYDHLPFVGDSQSVLDEIESFLKGLKDGPQADGVLASVLCIIASQSDALDEMARFRKRVRQEVSRFRGEYFFDDPFLLAKFDGPVRSILCGLAVADLAKKMNLNVKCGLEIGTCSTGFKSLSGPAVEGANRIAQLADHSTVLVTQTLKNLITGSELKFVECKAGDDSQLSGGKLYRVAVESS